MKIRFVMFLVVCCMVLSITAASAATVNLKLATMSAEGWYTTVNPDSGGRGSVAEMSNYGGETSGTFQFTNGNIDLTVNTWAALSTQNYAGIHASQITALNIRLNGMEGDGTTWSPPHFEFMFRNALDGIGGGVRPAMWVPWVDGIARDPGVWHTYNALVDGRWLIPEIGGSYNTFALLVAAWPNATFAMDPSTYPYTYGGQVVQPWIRELY